MAKIAKPTSPLTGRWRIVSMNACDDGYIESTVWLGARYGEAA